MKKSITTDNVRCYPKSEFNFVKSKTSECLYHRNSIDSNMNHPTACNGLIEPCICDRANNPWMFSKPMYTKDKLVARSEQQLPDIISPTFPLPRKTSAPPYFDSIVPSDEVSCVMECNKVPKDSLTVDSFIDLPPSRRRKEQFAPIPCIVKGYIGNERTGSSLSKESESSLSSLTTPSIRSLSSTENEIDTLSLLSRESIKSEETQGSSECEDKRTSEDLKRTSEDIALVTDEKALIQIYAAYDTGLAAGVSVKLQISSTTTSREVIDMVVRELNRTVTIRKKRGPTYGQEKLKNFVLVTVLDRRERVLRDDIKLLSIGDPWKRGRFTVRLISDRLAAIESAVNSTKPKRTQQISTRRDSNTSIGSTASSGSSLLSSVDEQQKRDSKQSHYATDKFATDSLQEAEAVLDMEAQILEHADAAFPSLQGSMPQLNNIGTTESNSLL